MLIVDEEIRNDVLDYFPVITNKKIYYQLLTQHIDYYHHYGEHNNKKQAFQDDTFFLNKSSLEWRVPLTVQKRLDMMDTDWNKSPFSTTLHELPNIYLQQDVSLFLDDSSSTQVSKLLYRTTIDSSTWHWQEKSKCFPLIETADKHPPLCHPQHERQAYAADKTRKATYSHRCARKLALFDTMSTIVDIDNNHNNSSYIPPDYGREISLTSTTTTTPPAQAAAAAVKPTTTTAETSTNGHLQNNPPPACQFLPHREIDDFIKQKKQVNPTFQKQE
ncbi:hypothetical protein MBANPS3_000257 [Mucor bainieri]